MDASFSRDGAHHVLLVHRRLDHPIEKVWRAVTERDLLKQWFPADVEGEWRVGAPLRFHFLHGEGEGLSDDELSGEVLAVDAPRRLEFRWGSEVLSFELAPAAAGCELRLAQRVDDPSTGARNAAGWEMCLENLQLVLLGRSVLAFSVEVWREWFDRYRAALESEFGHQQGIPDSHPEAQRAVEELGDSR